MLSFSRSAMSASATPWTAARQASLSFPTAWRLLILMSVESVMPCKITIQLCIPYMRIREVESFIQSQGRGVSLCSPLPHSTPTS